MWLYKLYKCKKNARDYARWAEALQVEIVFSGENRRV